MRPGERADEPARELAAEHGFQTLDGARARFAQTGDAGAVVEEAADGLSVVERRRIHGPSVIAAPAPPLHPWRE
jgi:hypothetical protein